MEGEGEGGRVWADQIIKSRFFLPAVREVQIEFSVETRRMLYLTHLPSSYTHWMGLPLRAEVLLIVT